MLQVTARTARRRSRAPSRGIATRLLAHDRRTRVNSVAYAVHSTRPQETSMAKDKKEKQGKKPGKRNK